ncbi:enoyl-CoA hydratase family protein [Actinacidiphila acidipaludis]|uniref:Enoyl-CoA hydratase family protein n=1 Tax=Actinacidiphila acidipaludis TaxID=2873382 RepID=A0ABS7Q3W4_9ACTN|nr:enoyl-CoA hydratase family protein [Streptomyces acidipaludis]MBY8877851.1 enoyl-CoA hydratase family protein [Streptomyces acidipaludis]
MTTAPLVRRHTDRGVAVLTLDSPGNRNALSAELIADLAAALDEAGADPSVRAVLLTHAGTSFCAGADLKSTGIHKGPRLLVDLMRQIAVLPKPVVARVDGHVRAGGLGLLAACDISVATGAASFAFTESRLGLAPAVASLPVLARADRRAAARWIITGERFGTAEAVRMGLVTAEDDALDGILAGLRAASPQGLTASKALTTAAFLERLDADAEALCQESARLFASEDAAEGVRALLERRDPPWAL